MLLTPECLRLQSYSPTKRRFHRALKSLMERGQNVSTHMKVSVNILQAPLVPNKIRNKEDIREDWKLGLVVKFPGKREFALM